MKATAGAIQTGLSLYAANQLAAGNAKSFPTYLEATDLADGTAASDSNLLFNAVLQAGVTSQWFKKDDDCYVYDTNGNGTLNAAGTDNYYQYLTAAGTFLPIAAGC